MSLDSLVAKTVLIKFEGDADDLNKEVKGVGKTLDAITSKVGGFAKSISSGFGSGLGSIKSFADSVGKLNPAIELGGKALAAMGAGLDEVAKRGGEAGKAAANLKAEFGGYVDDAKYGLGIVTLELGRQAMFANDIAKHLAEAGQTEFFRKFGLNTRGQMLGSFLAGDDEAATRTLDTDKLRVSLTVLNRVVGEAKTNYDALTAAQKRAREEGERWRLFIAGVASKEAKDATDELVKRLEFEVNEYQASHATRGYGLSAYGDAAMEKNAERFKGINESLAGFSLDNTGFVDEMAKYSGALDTFANASRSAYEAITGGTSSTLEAIKAIGKQQLLSLGGLEVVEAIRQYGLGFGALANPLFPGAAALHFKSATLHTAGAAAAGIGIAAISKIGGGGGGGSAPSAGSGGGSSGGDAQAQKPQTITTTNVYLVQGDSFSDDSPRIRQAQAEKLVRLGIERSQSITGAF